MVASHHLEVIVEKTHCSIAKGHSKNYPHVNIIQPGPQQTGKSQREKYQQTAHGGSAGFSEVRFRAIVTNHLSYLEFP